MPRAVRDATFDVMRERGLTTIFANPGSTEVSFLGALPDDIRFVLALHEGVGGGHGQRATRSAAASPPSCSCTPPPGSATRWPRSPPRA